MDKSVKQKIISIFGDRASDQPEDLLIYGYDATKQEYKPDMVVFAKDTNEVSSLLKLANEYRFPVTPRGAGSGYVGGSIPLGGGVELSLSRMNRIVKIDQENLTALVEPGLVNATLQKAVEEVGLFYPPDPASLKFSTIGGNVATSAGGPRAVKYGVTSDYVLGMQVVLPSSEIIDVGSETFKSVVGYNLTKLMIGSEGTLGVITRILLKLLPLPEKIKTSLAIFKDTDSAAKVVAAIIKSRVIPRTLEFIDRSAIIAVEEYLKYGLPTDAGAILLIETDGTEDQASKDLDKIRKISADFNLIDFHIAKDNDDKEKIWNVRRSISTSLLRIRPHKINEDVTVPRSLIPELMKRLEKLSKEKSLPIINFGHAGDGNIHVNVMTDKKDKKEYEKAVETVDEVFKICLELKGTLSGEHGIGITKSAWIELEIGKVQLEIMRKIKKLFDPNNILNPGKIFPDLEKVGN